MMPVESTMLSPSGVYSEKHNSPMFRTIGDAEIRIAVSRADTSAPRSFENDFSKPIGSPSLTINS